MLYLAVLCCGVAWRGVVWRDVMCSQEDKVRGIFVKGLQQIVVESADKLEALMIQGNSVRHQAATQMNDRSSRSHSIFCIRIQQRDADNEQHNVFAKVTYTQAWRGCHARARGCDSLCRLLVRGPDQPGGSGWL